MDDTYDFLFSLLLIGDSGVGKTNILNRFACYWYKFYSSAYPTYGKKHDEVAGLLVYKIVIT